MGLVATFFEDISLNPFKDTLKVPFVDYRCNNQSHIILLLSCKAKQQWNWQVYIDMNLLRSAGQSRVCFNLRPFHFLFGLVVWYLPLAGCALFTWLCQGMRMFPMHQSWQKDVEVQRLWSMHSYWTCSKRVDMEWAGHSPFITLLLASLVVICDDLRVSSHPHHCQNIPRQPCANCGHQKPRKSSLSRNSFGALSLVSFAMAAAYCGPCRRRRKVIWRLHPILLLSGPVSPFPMLMDTWSSSRKPLVTWCSNDFSRVLAIGPWAVSSLLPSKMQAAN